jgi:hypothetical protein
MSFARIGSDPETFLANNLGEFISSVGLIGGSKDEPMPIGDGCFVQEDNVTVEFNTPPTNDVKEFVRVINYNLSWITNRASELGLTVINTPSARFSKEQLDSKEAQTFGCEPDFNAWLNGTANPRPRTKDASLRSAGGHIHIEAPGLDKLELTKAMDLFVGAQMVAFDDDTERRQLYGKAGAFRPKTYGIEYRTASNAWLRSDELKEWAFNQTQKAVQFVKDGKQIPDELGAMLQDCINKSDVTLLARINEVMRTL